MWYFTHFITHAQGVTLQSYQENELSMIIPAATRMVSLSSLFIQSVFTWTILCCDSAFSTATWPLNSALSVLPIILNDSVTVVPRTVVQASSISFATKRRKAKPVAQSVRFYADVDMMQHTSPTSSIPRALSREPTLAAMLPMGGTLTAGEALEGLLE